MASAHPYEMSLQDAAERVWRIAYLRRESAMDRKAAENSLSYLYHHKHKGLQRLCVRVAETMDRPSAPIGEPVVEVFAR